MRAGLRELGPNEMHEGDVLIVSEAAVLGKHINDVVAYTPVRCNGALIGFFPVVINTAVGLSQIDNDMLDLGRV